MRTQVAGTRDGTLGGLLKQGAHKVLLHRMTIIDKTNCCWITTLQDNLSCLWPSLLLKYLAQSLLTVRA